MLLKLTPKRGLLRLERKQSLHISFGVVKERKELEQKRIS